MNDDANQGPEDEEDRNEFESSFDSAPTQVVARAGEVARGKVARITDDAAIIDLGSAQLPLPLTDLVEATLRVGDSLEVLVVEAEEGVHVSVRLAKKQADWDRIAHAHGQATPLQGEVVGPVLGGYAVRLGGVDAFLPTAEAAGQGTTFYVVSFQQKNEQVVVSRRALSERKA